MTYPAAIERQCLKAAKSDGSSKRAHAASVLDRLGLKDIDIGEEKKRGSTEDQ